MIRRLEDGPRSIESLVDALLEETPPADRDAVAGAWLRSLPPAGAGPTDLIKDIQDELASPAAIRLANAILVGLAFSLHDRDAADETETSIDRLPLARARREAASLASTSIRDAVHHVLESWVLAQHSYWSIGRGLADARRRGKMLLRLKVILDEGGWTVAPGATRASRPLPTADRLATAISLAKECGMFVAYAPDWRRGGGDRTGDHLSLRTPPHRFSKTRQRFGPGGEAPESPPLATAS